MTKVYVTSEGYEGAVVLLYGEGGVGENTFPPLLEINFKEAVLKDATKDWIKSRAPLRMEPGYVELWQTTKLKIVVEEAEVDFESDFWKPYGKPVNRKRCEAIWDKMSKTNRGLAAARLLGYLWHLSQNQWKAKADPETYLKKQMYLTDWYRVTN